MEEGLSGDLRSERYAFKISPEELEKNRQLLQSVKDRIASDLEERIYVYLPQFFNTKFVVKKSKFLNKFGNKKIEEIHAYYIKKYKLTSKKDDEDFD